MSTTGEGTEGRPSEPRPAPAHWFVTTRWTVVLTAGGNQTTLARDALARLCQTYWYPLYAYVRRRGYPPADAEDLTQGFFARLLELNSLAGVRREKGRFRSFLLAAMNHYLADERDRAGAQKRGAGKVVSLEIESAETRYRLEPVDRVTPEDIFQRQWAMTLLGTVLQALQKEYEAAGKGELFTALGGCLTGEKGAAPTAELAARLRMSEGAVRVAAHRLRQRYRELLRAEIAHTVASPAEVEEELRHLFRVLSG